MSSTAATQPTSGSAKGAGRYRSLIITLAIVAVILAVFFWFTGVYTDILWFTQLGYFSVVATQWIATAAVFLAGLIAMALPVAIVLQIAYRSRPVYARLSQQLDRYQKVVEPLRRVLFIVVPLVFGIFAGLSVAPSWPSVLAFLNATPFGTTDPLFGLDIGFYVFQLPFWRGVIAFALAVIVVAMIGAVAVNYLYGGIRLTGREIVISKQARVLIAVLAALYLLVLGVQIWFMRYDALTGTSGRWSGAMYTQANAVIPGQAILAIAAGIVAVLFLVAAAVGRWRLPLIGVVSLVLVASVVGAGYPWAVQSFQVGPNEQALEAEYIQHNIDATRTAYGLDQVNTVDYAGVTTAEAGQLRQDATTTANIRILDPALVSPTFAQFEQEKGYYSFPSELDVDRYNIDEKVQDAVLAVRDINVAGLAADAQTWVNQALVYTHGYGMVAAYGNQRGPDGQPLFFASGMPQTGKLGDFEPRVYFGETSPAYSIVGGAEGGAPQEFDHVTGADGASQTYSTFTGDGGPSLGNIFNRLAYALKFQSEQILLSNQVNEKSQILYNRNPIDRVQAAAPYLTLDSDTYPSVVDGRIVWIVDGYTTTNEYPYSTAVSMRDAATDSNTPSPTTITPKVNYVRNSVKATVDAYDGSVTLYAWDETDPVLQTWQKVFPNTLKPVSEMSGDLLSHVRYPEDMFKVQRQLFATYHVTNAVEFYSQSNAWQLPAEPTYSGDAAQAPAQAPYYLTTQMPEQDPAFSLYSTYIPRVASSGQSRNVLTGYLSANANAGSTPGEIKSDYGKLTLLKIANDSVNGPGQVQNIFSSNEAVASQLNLLQRGGSTQVEKGNLLTVPVGGGFLYVQPVYVKSTGETQYPLLRRVLVAFGDRVAFEETLDKALDVLFGGDSGTQAGDSDIDNAVKDPEVEVPDADSDDPGQTTDPSTDSTTPPTTTAPTTSGSALDDLNAALATATQALQDRTDAYARNDLVAAAEADQRLVAALKQADEARQRL